MSKGKTIYVNEEQFLREFGNERTTIAMPNSSKNMGNSINQAKQMNPSAKDVMVDTSMFDSTSNNDPIQLDVNAKNGQDAQKQINTMMSNNPQLKQLSNKGNLMANVHMEGKVYTKQQIQEQRLKYLRENTKTFTKQQIEDKILNKE